MPATATKPAAASGTRAPSKTGARAAAADSGLLRERASYYRSQGLTDTEVRNELRDEGFKPADISSALGSTSSDVDASPASEPPPASPGSSSAAPAGGSKGRRSGPAPKRGSVGLGPLRISTPGTPAGMMLAVVAYPAVLAYLTGGTPGLKAWFRAKFLNQTSTDAGIQNEAFILPNFGTSGASATPTAALSTYGRPRQHVATPPASSNALPPNASGPNSYNAITGTWGDASGAASARGARAVAFARTQLGKPYKWGGTGPDRWDCSGLAQAAWRSAGVKIPRTTGQQLLIGRRVAKRNLIPGDLVFPWSGHVQIYAGSGQVIEAPRTGLKVRVMPLGTMLTARRPR